MQKPFFTVGIPTYHRAAALGPTIASVLDQTCGDFELLIADNASPDATREVVAGFANPRVRYVRHPENIGALRNFDSLLELATGDFFVLHQDDDRLHPEFLSRCLEAVRSRPGVVAYASTYWCGNDATGYVSALPAVPGGDDGLEGALARGPWEVRGIDAIIWFLFSDPFVHPGVAMRLEDIRAIGGYHHEVECSEDVVLQARVLARGNLMYDFRVGAVLRRHSGNAFGRMPHSRRRLRARNTLHLLVQVLDGLDAGWLESLGSHLDALATSRVRKALRDWIRYRGPKAIQRSAWEALRRRQSFLRSLDDLGFRRALRYLVGR